MSRKYKDHDIPVSLGEFINAQTRSTSPGTEVTKRVLAEKNSHRVNRPWLAEDRFKLDEVGGILSSAQYDSYAEFRGNLVDYRYQKDPDGFKRSG